MTPAWYGVQIFEPPLGRALSFRGEKKETEAQAVARMHSVAKAFAAPATLWRWTGTAWAHAGAWAWVNLPMYRQLVAQRSGGSSTWGRA